MTVADVLHLRDRRVGIVKLDGTRVGLLTENGNGTSFCYDAEYARRLDAVPISLTLPLRVDPYETPWGIHPFFSNLLPEGWLLEISLAKLKVSKDDPFGLLLSTCADCVGAVEIELLRADEPSGIS